MPPAFGSTWLVSSDITRSLFLSAQDVVIDALDAPLGGWIKDPYALGLLVVGQDKGLVRCGALLEWVYLDAPVDGWIEYRDALMSHITSYVPIFIHFMAKDRHEKQPVSVHGISCPLYMQHSTHLASDIGRSFIIPIYPPLSWSHTCNAPKNIAPNWSQYNVRWSKIIINISTA